MEKMTSRGLFDFDMSGEVDEDVVKWNNRDDGKTTGDRYVGLVAEHQDDTDADDEIVRVYREYNAEFFDCLLQYPEYQEAAKQVETQEIAVPTSHDGYFEVPVFVYTPKSLMGRGKNAAYIYAHGGGVIAGTAAQSKPVLDFTAVLCSVVVFNVDYRLAPETKSPNNVKDFYEVIKYVSCNAESLGIDPDKICISGDSGGGYICLGAMVLLAQLDQSHLVKLAIPSQPMVDDYSFGDPLSMTIEERMDHLERRKAYQLIASDLNSQKTCPIMFPGKASDEILSKFPPTVLDSREFDMFVTETSRLANRLRRVGRLLELVVIPGAVHGSPMCPGLKSSKLWAETMKKCIQQYLLL